MFNKFYSGKRVFVTGHTGFKGAWLTKWLLQMGAEVSGYSVDIPSEPSLFVELNLKKDMHHHMGDVRNLDELKKQMGEFRPDVVFHLAAQAYVRRSYADPVNTFSTNLMGTVNLLEAIRGVKSVQSAVIVTTDKCYLNNETGKPFVEDDKLGGSDPYSASKATAEIAFSSYYKSFFANGQGARIGSARAGNVIGGGDWSEDRLVPDCVKVWSKNESVTLRSPQSVRPWQHVLDSLNGYLSLGAQLAQNEKLNGESFNFGPDSASQRTVLELVQKLKKIWPQANYTINPDLVAHMKESHLLSLSFEKAHRILNWSPVYDFEKAVNETGLWYKGYYENPKSCSNLVDHQIRDFLSFAKANAK